MEKDFFGCPGNAENLVVYMYEIKLDVVFTIVLTLRSTLLKTLTA